MCNRRLEKNTHKQTLETAAVHSDYLTAGTSGSIKFSFTHSLK